MLQTLFKNPFKCNTNVTRCNISFFHPSTLYFCVTHYLSTIITIFSLSPILYISFYAPYCKHNDGFFCAGGPFVKKQRIFSAPEGHASKNNGFFLRRRVARQKTMDFFCARGSGVKKRRLFSAPPRGDGSNLHTEFRY